MRIVTNSAVLALLLASLVLVGCQSTGTDKAAAASSSLEAYNTGLQKGLGDVDRAVDMLKQLSDATGQLRPQFETLQAAIATLDSHAQRLRSMRETMTANKNAYFAKWNENNSAIKDPELRKASEGRRTEAMSAFEKLSKDVTDGANLFKPFMSKLKDIEKYLDVNLNAAGIKAVGEKVKEIAAEAGPVKEKVAAVQADLESLIATMRNSTPTKA